MKMRMQSGLGWGIAAFLALSAALSAQAQKVADRDMRTRGRQNYDVVVGDVYTGRSPYFRGTEPQVAQAKPAALAKPAVPCSTATTGLVSLGKTAPSDASLGEPFTYELKALASGCAGNVVVTDTLPEGVSLVSSQPEASVTGRNLT